MAKEKLDSRGSPDIQSWGVDKLKKPQIGL